MRSHVATAGVVLALGVLAAACADAPAAEPSDTVGQLPEPTDIGTISPIIVETLPPDLEGTAPPGSIFGGDPCTALVPADFTQVTFNAVGSGTLVDAFPPSIDSCQFTVEVGDDQYVVVVQIRTQSEFESPQGTPPPDTSPIDSSPIDTATSTSAAEVTPDEIDDVGNAAVGVTQGTEYEVIVEVDNGWFSVRTPDATSATYLAGRAATRAG